MSSLSGRFLVLTLIFVMLAEVMIFVPSIARFRQDYLLDRLEKAQIAAMAVIAGGGMIDAALEDELLAITGVLNVALRRNEYSQLMLSQPGIAPVTATFDLRDATALELMRDSLVRLATPGDHTIRVLGNPVQQSGMLIDVTMQAGPLRMAMIDYGLRILALSLFISVITAALLFFAVRRLMVSPIRRVVRHMTAYAEAPEDATRIIDVQAGVRELNEAETALNALQTDLTGALKQRQRLVRLGEAVAKISHDLRNILNVATLVADRLEISEDPGVRRVTPRLVKSLDRAVSLCENALAFGRAEEPPPRLTRVDLAELVQEVLDNDQLAAGDAALSYVTDVEQGVLARIDPEQMYRVLGNLVRNARQAITATGKPGQITVAATVSDEAWVIELSDTGPGLPQKAQDHLFQAFQGGVRQGGSGLGLVIASELVKGHGGHLELIRTGESGTVFRITLPTGVAA